MSEATRTPLPRDRFRAELARELQPGRSVLDIGAGRRPVFARDERPAGCVYVGSDVDADEMARAADEYDDTVVDDLTRFNPALEGRFDLILSWQVLEHVRPLDVAFENIRRYLKPGGKFAARMTGRYAPFAIINRLLPRRLGTFGMQKLMGRAPDTVFRAYYDRAYHSRLTGMLRSWHSFEIRPEYVGSNYFGFAPPLASLHRAYDRWAVRHPDLASHYVIIAVA